MITLELPDKGFTKAERAWLKELINAIKTVQGIAGRNCSITESQDGQTISGNDCPPCP